jgi:serine/threonine-protein kinase RsbT
MTPHELAAIGGVTTGPRRAARRPRDRHTPDLRATQMIPIEADVDVLAARRAGHHLASSLGFSSGNATIVATVISELARNMLLHAGRGEILLDCMEAGDRCGITITARDQGDGIPDIDRALQDGFSTLERLGLGLTGVRRLMDEFHLVSEMGKGTTVEVTKWKG